MILIWEQCTYVTFIGFEYWGVFLNLILRHNKWEKKWWKYYKEAGYLEGFKRCIKVMILYNINLFVMVMDYKKEMSVLTVQHIKSKIPKEGV